MNTWHSMLIILMPTSATCVFHNFLRNLSFLSSIANLFHRREPITLQVSMLNIHMTPAHLCIVLILYFGVDGNQAWLIHHGTIECGGAETFVASVNTCYSFISNWMAGVCGKWIVKELSLMCIQARETSSLNGRQPCPALVNSSPQAATIACEIMRN